MNTKWATNMSDGIIRTSNTLSAADNVAKFGAKYDMWKLPASHKQFQQKKPQLSAWMQPMPIDYNNINYGAPSKDYRESTQTGVDMYYPFQQMIPNYNGAPYPAPYPTTALNNLPVLPYNEPMMQNYMAMQRQMIAMAYYMHMQNNMPILPNHMLMMPDNNVHGEMAQNSFVRNNMPSNGEIESQRQKS
ncbi:uncharacterized protein LOC131845462 isoform X2 [Achroia grisella]|uniref:uncharacterized protein LOC131845462 isoform X2 n=1 Tax=Achroia grisella TaxID=688607 RepID=UPI0027D2622D|nr:uncharacterized protein LOC131845462 isoform X2 [Achroia grisella]